MRTGSAARRTRILQSLAPDRQELVKNLKDKINKGSYVVDGKLDLIADELIEQAVRLRN